MRLLAKSLVILGLPAVILQSATSGAESRGKASPSNMVQPAMVRSVLPFSHDDYTAARSRAQKQSKILIVEAWATWCHTCQSMRSFVFTDPLLKPMADRFVFVALDTDRPINAPFIERFPITSWPTILALDPGQSSAALTDERVVARWTGSMTAAELLAKLDRTTGRSAGADKLLEQADAAAAEGRWDAAAPLYGDAVRQSISDRPRALLGEIQALKERGEYGTCADMVDSSLNATGNSAPATDFAAYAAVCLDHLSDVDRRQRLRMRLKAHLVTLAEDPNAPLSVDDRSDAYGTIIELSDALGDRPAGDRYADARLRLLEAAATNARTAGESATFDAHRLDSYRRLRRYEAAEKMLLSSARALPTDFNPPSRLARLYWDMGRLDDAMHQVNEALGKAYGPRRASLLELQASIRHGLGQTKEAVQSLLSAIAVVESMPVRNEHRLALLRRQIAALQDILSGVPPRRTKSRTQPGAGLPSKVEPPIAALPISLPMQKAAVGR